MAEEPADPPPADPDDEEDPPETLPMRRRLPREAPETEPNVREPTTAEFKEAFRAEGAPVEDTRQVSRPIPPTTRMDSPTARLSRGDIAAALQAPFVQPILRFPLKRVFVWACLFALIYYLRSYFAIIFLTFVTAYISTTVVGRLTPLVRSRRLAVVLVYMVIIGSFMGLGAAIVPGAVAEGKVQLERLRKIENAREFFKEQVREYSKSSKWVKDWKLEERLDDPIARQWMAESLDAAQTWVGESEVLETIWKTVSTAVRNVLLALLFSFLIVWDLPKLERSVKLLRESKLGPAWAQVGPSIGTFFRLLGRAFEAQTAIAVVNTALTCLGMLFLGIPGIGLLAVIVFLCSFIPVAGVFISTVPICIMALQGGGGIGLVVGVIIMVTVVHIVEAYLLNPRIYGHHMRLHPLAVLVVLFLAGSSPLGLWGLIIAVPVATYVWRHWIRGEAEGPAPGDDVEPSAEQSALPDPEPVPG